MYVAANMLHVRCLLSSTLKDDLCLSDIRLYGDISQDTVLFIVTDV
jgi:hypothetical protein